MDNFIKKVQAFRSGNFDETKEANAINSFEDYAAKGALKGCASKSYLNRTSDNEYVECRLETTSMHPADVEYASGSNNEQWQEIKPTKDTFLLWETGGYTFKTSNGVTIKTDDIANIKVMENKDTGEVLITGAKNASITGGSSDVVLTVRDSSINNIKMGKGSDTINIENSNVKQIETGDGDNVVNVSKKSEVTSLYGGKGNDIFNVDSSTVDKIDAKNGQDTINVKNSQTNLIYGGGGNDSINVENSTVKTEVSGGDGDDFVHISNSDVTKVSGNSGNDDILVEKSNLSVVDGNSGADTIIVNSSNAKDIYGGNDDDIIKIQGSNVQNIDGGWGADTINYQDSNISKIADDKKDTVKSLEKKEDTPPCDLDSDTAEVAQDVTKSVTSKYSKKELTPEQEMQALTIDFFSQNLEKMKSQFSEQESQDGLVHDAYNWVKELLDLGVSKEDISKAIQEQEKMVKELQAAMNGSGKESFEEVFKRWTGVEYNQDKIGEYMENVQMYSLASAGLVKAQAFTDKISNEVVWSNVIDDYIAYYGSEEKAIEKLNELFTQTAQQLGCQMFDYPYPISSVEIIQGHGDAKYQIKITPDPRWNGQEEIFDITEMPFAPKMFFYNLQNCVGSITHPGQDILSDYVNDFKSQFENITGKSIEDLQTHYAVSQIEAFGSGGAFQKLIDKYCADQDGFADKISTTMQIGGIGLMVVGGVVTFFCPPAGYAMLEAGKYTAIAGTFADNALDLFDDLTSESGLSKEEAWDNIKETLTELALLYSGAKINGVAASVKDFVFTETQSKTLAFLAQLGTDTTLSLLTDLMITGDINLTGEGISQLLGIITGLAGAKIDAYTKEAFETADAYFKNGDFDGAKKYLDSKGIPYERVYTHYRSLEFERINNVFKSTGSIEEALKALSNSKFLTKADMNSLSAELKLGILSKNGIDISKYKGYDFNSTQGKLVAEDIDLYYKSLTKGIKIEDLMVPKMDNFESALKYAKIGGVFEVEGSDGLYIRTSNNGYKKLDMSKEAYCKLFPALDRYSSGQMSSGDCYLVSALNSMMATANGREKLLSCFKENSDGSISVKMPNSDTEITIKPGQTIEDLGVKPGKHMTGSLGLQMLEYAYKVDLVNSRINNIDNDIYAAKSLMLNEYTEYIHRMDIPESHKNLSFDEFRLKAKEANNELISMIEKVSGKNVKADKLNSEYIIDLFSVVEGYYFANGELTELGLSVFSKAFGISPDNKIELNRIYKELAPKMEELGYLVQKNNVISRYEEQIKVYESAKADIENNDLSAAAEKLGGNGGHSSAAFSAFGMQNPRYEEVGGTFFERLITNPEAASNCILTAGTIATKQDIMNAYNDPDNPMYDFYHKNPESYRDALNRAPDTLPYGFGLVSNHAYSFEVRKNTITGETEIVVTNPWALESAGYGKELVLTVEQFKQCFSSIYVGEI